MNTLSILSENNYREEMDTIVSPFLRERMTETRLFRRPKQPIYCAYYRADDPKGVVLISHGFTESAKKHIENAYYFVSAGYDTYVMEHCGHGRSYRLQSDPSLVHIDHFERYVEDLLFVARTARRAHPKLPLFLFAHSMGGGIGAAAASVAPDLFARIILTSPMIRPLTGDHPWLSAYIQSELACRTGKRCEYLPGQQPYSGPENFSDSAALSRARFDYYREIRQNNPLFQTSAASYGWLREAMRMNRYLQTRAWRRIQCPLLLFQAEQESFVDNAQQALFIQKLNSAHEPITIKDTTVPFARLVRVANAKHEIFSSQPDVLKTYWKTIFDFLGGN